MIAQAVAGFTADNWPQPGDQIRVAIGSEIDLDVAQQSWPALVAGTPIATHQVTWERALDTLACLDCGRTYQGTKLDPCPHCGGDGLIVGSAPEINITVNDEPP